MSSQSSTCIDWTPPPLSQCTRNRDSQHLRTHHKIIVHVPRTFRERPQSTRLLVSCRTQTQRSSVRAVPTPSGRPPWSLRAAHDARALSTVTGPARAEGGWRHQWQEGWRDLPERCKRCSQPKRTQSLPTGVLRI